MVRSKTTPDAETPTAYFRRIFREDRSLLKQGSNAAVFERWLNDHPGHKEVPDNIKAILHNVKSTLRNKRRQRRAEKGWELVAIEPPGRDPATPIGDRPARYVFKRQKRRSQLFHHAPTTYLGQ
jgi:hypothetical protein